MGISHAVQFRSYNMFLTNLQAKEHKSGPRGAKTNQNLHPIWLSPWALTQGVAALIA